MKFGVGWRRSGGGPAAVRRRAAVAAAGGGGRWQAAAGGGGSGSGLLQKFGRERKGLCASSPSLLLPIYREDFSPLLRGSSVLPPVFSPALH